MTTSVTITNNGKHRVNVNEVEPRGPRVEDEVTVNRHTLGVGATVTLNVWGREHYLCILETDDVDTPAEKLKASAGNVE